MVLLRFDPLPCLYCDRLPLHISSLIPYLSLPRYDLYLHFPSYLDLYTQRGQRAAENLKSLPSRALRANLMADQPPGTLPTFYGEKTADGRIVQRPSGDDQEALITAAASAAPKGPQTGSMAFEDAGPIRDEPPSAERRQRWTIDDPRSRGPDDYWREQWERRRWERERDRDWYPEYRGPQRYIEWDPEDRVRLPRAYFSSGSRRSNAPLHYRSRRRSVDGYRRYDSDEEFEEEFYPKRTGAGGGGRGGNDAGVGVDPAPTEPESMRLPFTGWMGTFKGRELISMVSKQRMLGADILHRFRRFPRRTCRHDNVSVLCLCRYAGCQHWQH